MTLSPMPASETTITTISPCDDDVEAKEVTWTDACIRWTEEDREPHMRPSHQLTKKGDDEDDEDDEALFDPFADPDPTEDIFFEYVVPNNLDQEAEYFDAENDISSSRKVSIRIQGYKADTDEAWESTGLTLWKATRYLNEFILSHFQEWKNQYDDCSILELGAGLGVCGILSAKLLTSMTIFHAANESSETTSRKCHVCITDGDTEALALLRQNVRDNQLASKNGQADNEQNVQVSCRQLLWGKEPSQNFAIDSSKSSWPIIIASDIIYAPQVLVPLWETIQVLLSDDGIFVLAFAKRKVPVQLDDVLRTADEYGFKAKSQIDTNEDGVFLYEFRRATNTI